MEDGDEAIRSNIGVIVLQNQMWVLIIKSKRFAISHNLAIPQALTYMWSSPSFNKPSFRLATNGSNFVFLKLSKQNAPKYAFSKDFSLINRRNDLYDVLKILKRLGTLSIQ